LENTSIELALPTGHETETNGHLCHRCQEQLRRTVAIQTISLIARCDWAMCSDPKHTPLICGWLY